MRAVAMALALALVAALATAAAATAAQPDDDGAIVLLGAPELAEDFGLDLNEEPGSRPGTAPKEGKE